MTMKYYSISLTCSLKSSIDIFRDDGLLEGSATGFVVILTISSKDIKSACLFAIDNIAPIVDEKNGDLVLDDVQGLECSFADDIQFELGNPSSSEFDISQLLSCSDLIYFIHADKLSPWWQFWKQ